MVVNKDDGGGKHLMNNDSDSPLWRKALVIAGIVAIMVWIFWRMALLHQGHL